VRVARQPYVDDGNAFRILGDVYTPKVIGTQILSVNMKLDRLLDRLPPESVAVRDAEQIYSPRPELDTESRSISREDTEAEIQLNLIRQLVDRRQGRAALHLLSDLQPSVDTGVLSPAVRARFFINRGVCHVLDRSPDSRGALSAHVEHL
jgi:hypothetical protein